MPVLTTTANRASTTRGAVLAQRARVELLIDPDAPLLELSPTRADLPGCRSPLVAAIGIVARVPCVILAEGPATTSAAFDHRTASKAERATTIASANGLPLIYLLESRASLAALTADHEVHTPATTVAAVFGNAADCEANLATTPGCPVVVSRSIDFVAADEPDALRVVRSVVSGLASASQPCRPTPEPPHHDIADLMALAATDLATPIEPYRLLELILDSSRFDEFKPSAGLPVHVGWGAVHGYPVAIFTDDTCPWNVEVTRRVQEFVGLAALSQTPVLRFHDGGLSRSPIPKSETSLRSPVNLGNSVAVTIVVRGPVASAEDHVTGHRWPKFDPGFRFRWPDQCQDVPAECPVSDDGTIDPRDTRTVVGLCLAVMAHARNNPAAAKRHPPPEKMGDPRR